MHCGCKSVTFCCQDLNNCLQMTEKQNPQSFSLFCMHTVVYSRETRLKKSLRDQRGQKIKRMKRTDGNVKFIQKDFHGVSCSPLLHSKVYNLLQSCFKFHRRHQTLPIMSRSIAQENIFSWWGAFGWKVLLQNKHKLFLQVFLSQDKYKIQQENFWSWNLNIWIYFKMQ